MRRLAGMMDLGNWLTLEMRRRSAWTIGRRSKSSSPWRIDLRVSDIPYHRPGSVAIRILPVRVGMAILMALLDCLRRRRTLDVEGLLAKIGEVVVYLGGGGVVVLGLSGWIGKIFSNRFVEKLKQEIQHEMESYRTKLKKSEFLFQKEFEAASHFISLRRSFLPDYIHPDMEWPEVCEYVALNLESIEESLSNFRATHGVALKESVLSRLDDAITAAGTGKFEEISLEHIPIDGAEKVLRALQEIESELRDAVWSQSST